MIYAHDDRKFWGKMFIAAAGRQGIEAKLFKNPVNVPEGSVAFVRVDQERKERDMSKGLIKALHQKSVTTLPTYQESIWYDDKWLQYEALSDHMPETYLVESGKDARKFTDYPLVSKSREGSASANVRFISGAGELDREIRLAWSKGIPMSYGRRQKNYLMLQRFVPGNDHDYRVFVTGDQYWGAIRYNRDDLPFASGSGKREAITELSGRALSAFDFCHEITQELGTQWMAYDVVFDGDEPLLLEFSSAWPPQWCPHSPCFVKGKKWEQTDRFGGHMFDFAVEILSGTGTA